eukprot:876931-Pyramimonas_sp.AAC.1
MEPLFLGPSTPPFRARSDRRPPPRLRHASTAPRRARTMEPLSWEPSTPPFRSRIRPTPSTTPLPYASTTPRHPHTMEP